LTAIARNQRRELRNGRILRELTEFELDAVSGGAAAAAATTSGDNALAAANNTGPTAVTTTFAIFIALGAGPSAVGVAS
jgi:hypothetical protein